MDAFSIGEVVQGGMLLVLGATAKVVYSTSVLCAKLETKIEAQEKRIDRIEEDVDGIAS